MKFSLNNEFRDLVCGQRMIRISAKKTLTVLEFILNNKRFSQSEIRDKTKSSIGLVNKIVNWLLDKQFISKVDSKYELTQPNRLVELISIQTTIKRVQTYEISLPRKKVLDLIEKNKGILCLNSALEFYQKKSKDDEIHIYLPSTKLKQILDKTERGNQKIHIYSTDLESETKFKTKTDELRTILDFCSLNKHDFVTKLSLNKWGTLQ
jgi:DNA-binding MarR family transcriptional regulator